MVIDAFRFHNEDRAEVRPEGDHVVHFSLKLTNGHSENQFLYKMMNAFQRWIKMITALHHLSPECCTTQ